MNSSKVEPLFLQLKDALDAHDFKSCASLTKKLFLQDVCVTWEGTHRFGVSWGQWQPGESGSFRSSNSIVLSYTTWTKPSARHRIGNYWTGCGISALTVYGSKHFSRLDEAEFERAAKLLG